MLLAEQGESPEYFANVFTSKKEWKQKMETFLLLVLCTITPALCPLNSAVCLPWRKVLSHSVCWLPSAKFLLLRGLAEEVITGVAWLAQAAVSFMAAFLQPHAGGWVGNSCGRIQQLPICQVWGWELLHMMLGLLASLQLQLALCLCLLFCVQLTWWLW